MNRFLVFLGTPPVSDIYLLFCLAVLIVPMIILARWYRREAARTEGGQRLQADQKGSWQRGGSDIGKLSSDIEAGRYGESVRSLQHRTYRAVAAWLTAVAICFGLLIWSQGTANAQ